MWPLARPNVVEKGWPLQTLARDDRQTHFATFNFWVKPIVKPFIFGNETFLAPAGAKNAQFRPDGMALATLGIPILE